MLINRQLVKFGPEANDARELLRKYTIARIATTWPGEAGAKPGPDDPLPWKLLESLQQKRARAQDRGAAFGVGGGVWGGGRFKKDDVARGAQEAEHVQHPYILILILWLFVLFASFGLFAPGNGMVVAALFIGALAIAGAVLVIVGMDSPYVSPQPMQQALAQMSGS
jgi:hypothetical protein